MTKQYREIEVHGGKQGLYFEVHGNAAGFVTHNEPRVQDTIVRYMNPYGRNVVTYKGLRYKVRGGIRTNEFINLALPIKPNRPTAECAA